MRDAIKAWVDDLNARYRRVVLDDVVIIDQDSPRGFWKEVKSIIKHRRSGRYEVVVVHYPDANDFVPKTLDDKEMEIEVDKASELLKELSGDCGWVIPSDDPLFDQDWGPFQVVTSAWSLVFFDKEPA